MVSCLNDEMCLQSRNICAHLENYLVISRAVFGDHMIFCGDHHKYVAIA